MKLFSYFYSQLVAKVMDVKQFVKYLDTETINKSLQNEFR